MKREGDTSMRDVPLSHLPAEEKAKRSGTFGAVASNYERYRPGPPADAVDWILDGSHGRFVDLGAGTGALTRVLVPRALEVVAVEPDDRMRSVLALEVPGAVALKGSGESIPVADGWADAVLASSSWHWMDLLPTLAEVARVLVPGGVLGALWSGPDPEGSFLTQARALIEQQSAARGAPGATTAPSEADGGEGELASLIMTDADRPNSTLEIPQGVPFDQPQHQVFVWDVALTADDLIGLLSTFSWIIMMSEEVRQGVFAEARRLLREFLGVEGDVTVDVAFRCEAWRSRRHA
jgi:SAM-dependent methyltransferase